MRLKRYMLSWSPERVALHEAASTGVCWGVPVFLAGVAAALVLESIAVWACSVVAAYGVGAGVAVVKRRRLLRDAGVGASRLGRHWEAGASEDSGTPGAPQSRA